MLSSLVCLLWIYQIIFSAMAGSSQAQVIKIQQAINEGNNEYKSGNALARRIYEVSQQKNDPALRDVLTRARIPTPTSGPSADTPARPAAAPAAVKVSRSRKRADDSV